MPIQFALVLKMSKTRSWKKFTHHVHLQTYLESSLNLSLIFFLLPRCSCFAFKPRIHCMCLDFPFPFWVSFPIWKWSSDLSFMAEHPHFSVNFPLWWSSLGTNLRLWNSLEKHNYHSSLYIVSDSICCWILLWNIVNLQF